MGELFQKYLLVPYKIIKKSYFVSERDLFFEKKYLGSTGGGSVPFPAKKKTC